MPPEVVRTRASSTVLVKASRRVKRDFAGMVGGEGWVGWRVVEQECGDGDGEGESRMGGGLTASLSPASCGRVGRLWVQDSRCFDIAASGIPISDVGSGFSIPSFYQDIELVIPFSFCKQCWCRGGMSLMGGCCR